MFTDILSQSIIRSTLNSNSATNSNTKIDATKYEKLNEDIDEKEVKLDSENAKRVQFQEQDESKAHKTSVNFRWDPQRETKDPWGRIFEEGVVIVLVFSLFCIE